MPEGASRESVRARTDARSRGPGLRRSGDRREVGGLSPLHGWITALQRKAGNRAVVDLIDGATPLQRQPEPATGTADPSNLAPRGLPGLGGPPDSSLLEPPHEAPPPAGGPASSHAWDLEYSVYGTPERFAGLTDEQAIEKLDYFYYSLLDDMRNGEKRQRSWQEEFGGSFSSRWAAGTASIVGGADWPDVSNWVEVAKYMADAGQMLRESRWAAMLASGKGEQLDEAARMSAVALDEKRLESIVGILEEGDHRADKAEKDWQAFLKDTEKGASRTVTGLKVAKVAGAVAATYLTGGAAGALELGTAGTATLVAVGGGTYAATQNLAGQVGEIVFSDRTSIDWGSVAKEGAIATAAGFVGGAVGGKLAGTIGNGLGKLVGGMAPETMEAFGIEGAELLTGGEKLFAQWAGGTLGTPFSTTTQVLMQAAIDGKWPVTSVQDFFDLVLSDMVKSGAINGFFTYVHTNAQTVEPPAGGGGSSGGESSAGGGGGGDGVPVHVGPEGDTYLSPNVSTGVPEYVGPEGDAYLGPNISTGVPEYVGPEGDAYLGPNVSTGVPEYVGPEGDASVPPGTVSGIPEYIGPGSEPTQPMGPAYEPTAPAPAAGEAPPRSGTRGEEESGPRTAAERGGPTSRAGGGEGAEEMSWADELRWIYRPPGLKAMVVDHAVTDPVELTQLVTKANAYGARVIRVDGTTPEGAARLDQLWHASYAQQGAAPSAWVDTFGNVVVDEAAHAEINAVGALQGPVPEPAGAPEEEMESDEEGGILSGGELLDRTGSADPGPGGSDPRLLGRDRRPPPGCDDEGPRHLPLRLGAPVRATRGAPAGVLRLGRHLARRHQPGRHPDPPYAIAAPPSNGIRASAGARSARTPFGRVPSARGPRPASRCRSGCWYAAEAVEDTHVPVEEGPLDLVQVDAVEALPGGRQLHDEHSALDEEVDQVEARLWLPDLFLDRSLGGALSSGFTGCGAELRCASSST